GCRGLRQGSSPLLRTHQLRVMHVKDVAFPTRATTLDLLVHAIRCVGIAWIERDGRVVTPALVAEIRVEVRGERGSALDDQVAGAQGGAGVPGQLPAGPHLCVEVISRVR